MPGLVDVVSESSNFVDETLERGVCGVEDSGWVMDGVVI